MRRGCALRGVVLGGFAVLVPAALERLRLLASVAIDGDRLQAQLPGLDVGFHDVVDGGVLGQVDGLGDGAGDERLRGGHHPQVSHVGMERVPFAGLKEQSKTARCSSLMCGAPSMVPVASM